VERGDVEHRPDDGAAASDGCGGRGEIHALTAASVKCTAETLNRVRGHAVQARGGAGYIWESEINRLYRSIEPLEIGAGTPEVRKMILGEELHKRCAARRGERGYWMTERESFGFTDDELATKPSAYRADLLEGQGGRGLGRGQRHRPGHRLRHDLFAGGKTHHLCDR